MAILNSIFSTQGVKGIAKFSADTDDIIIGDRDTTFHADADDNIAIGINALDATSGAATQNVAIGTNTLTALTLGDYNVAIGYHAGAALSGAVMGCVVIGREALSQATSGIDECIAIGYRSMHNITSGEAVKSCVAIGTSTLRGEMVAASSGTVAVGHKALNTLTDAVGNVAIGYEALLGHTTGARNIAIGYGAMNDTDANDCPTSTDNIFIGYDAGGGTWVTNDSNFNVGIGNYCMDDAMDGALGNTAVGHSAMSALTTGGLNVAIGTSALTTATTAEKNTAVGHQALTTYDASGSGNNTAVGFYAGGIVSSGKNNTIMGSYAGDLLTTGSNNTIVGHHADVDVNSDSYQTRLGSYGALRYMTAQLTMSDFTTVADDDAATAPLLKIPRYGFLKRVTCTVVTANGGGTGEYQISLGTAVEAAGDTVAGQVEIIGADNTDDSDFTGATYRSSTFSADGDTQLNIETAKYVHIWEADQSIDDSSGWTLMEGQDMYLYVCHANASNATDGTNAVLRITAEFWGED